MPAAALLQMYVKATSLVATDSNKSDKKSTEGEKSKSTECAAELEESGGLEVDDSNDHRGSLRIIVDDMKGREGSKPRASYPLPLNSGDNDKPSLRQNNDTRHKRSRRQHKHTNEITADEVTDLPSLWEEPVNRLEDLSLCSKLVNDSTSQ